MTASLGLDTTPVLTPTMADHRPREEEKVEQEEDESVANICALVAEMPESDIPPYIGQHLYYRPGGSEFTDDGVVCILYKKVEVSSCCCSSVVYFTLRLQ